MDDDPQHQADAEEPDAANRQKQSQGPAPMGIETTRARMLQGHPRAGKNQQGIDADGDVLRHAAAAAARPHHHQAADAHHDGRADVDAAVPTMETWQMSTNDRQQLQRAADDDQHCKYQVQQHAQIAGGITGDMAMRQHLVPLFEAAEQRRAQIEADQVGDHQPLPEYGDGEPEHAGERQCLDCCGRWHQTRRRL